MLRFLRVLSFAVTFVVVGVGALAYAQYREFLQTPLAVGESGADYLVEPGTTVRAIAEDWEQRGWLSHHPGFVEFLARSRGQATRIKAGEYHLAARVTPELALELFTLGQVRQHRLTIIEGWTFARLLEAVHEHPALARVIEVGTAADEVMRRIGSEREHPEGWFLPDTYAFPRGTSDVEFLRRAHQAMLDYLDAAWPGRAEGLPLETPEQALILASIIEKETGVAEERGQIAGVFVERLERRMRLQTDPTVIYGLGPEFDGDIRFRDLRRDTPYNTYTRHGLPPTPIALPGRESIHAALHPERTGALYFVARGDGTHQFSATLEEHNRAVARYQLKR